MMDAVKILLERMDTNPEEFTRHSIWASIITEYKDLIPPDEIELLDAKLNEARTKQFTAAVLDQLMRGKDENIGHPIVYTGGGVVRKQMPDGRFRMESSPDLADSLVYKTKNRYAIGDTE
jgi:hypothetical protein